MESKSVIAIYSRGFSFLELHLLLQLPNIKRKEDSPRPAMRGPLTSQWPEILDSHPTRPRTYEMASETNPMPRVSKRIIAWSAPVGSCLLNFFFPLTLSIFPQHLGWNTGPSVWNFLGTIFIILGLGLFVVSLREQFRRMQNLSTVDVTSPNYLIQTGPYRFTRNPLYLGGAFVWLGWTIFFGSPLILGGLVMLLAGTSLIVIPWEERNLEKQFGDAYLVYKRTVPRWLGKRLRFE